MITIERVMLEPDLLLNADFSNHPTISVFSGFKEWEIEKIDGSISILCRTLAPQCVICKHLFKSKGGQKSFCSIECSEKWADSVRSQHSPEMNIL